MYYSPLVSTNLKSTVTLFYSISPYFNFRIGYWYVSLLSHLIVTHEYFLSEPLAYISITTLNLNLANSTNPLEYILKLNKLMFNCKLFKNIYLNNNRFNIVFDITRINIILHFILFEIHIYSRLRKVSRCIISKVNHNKIIN